ncbi:MAG: hypothetical protein ABFR50_01480 [Candidatus Fermentibacteria bacterium]
MFADSAVSGDFTTVSVLAPGPASGLVEMLPDSAAGAIELCDEWLREDLTIRFSDLLFEGVNDDMPILPAFTDINGDDLEDLVWSSDSGGPVTRAFLAPDWRECMDLAGSMELRKFCDLNNDGTPDSVYMSDEGVLTIFFEETVFQITEGFDITGVAGTALGDLENDGLADLLVGTDSGNLLIYRNRGSIEVPCFLPFVSESSVLFPMNAGAFSSPAVFLSGDSILIAAVGTQQNGLKFYTGNSDGSVMSREWVATDTPWNRDTLLNISPVEINLSGETVLICGTRNGSLCEARPGSDSLYLLQLSPVPGTYPNLAIASVNGDEFPDLVAGTMEGDVFYLPGYQGWFDGNWEKIDSIPRIPSGAPAAWKNGLLFGSSNGEVRFFARDGSGTWVDSTANSEFCNIDVGEYSTPDFADINGDGLEELIVGNSRGSLICFELDEYAVNDGPLYVERSSWKFEPNSSVSNIQSYYSRYFIPYSVFRVSSGVSEVNAFSREIMEAEPHFRDEIAYCIAHTPTEVLRAMYRNGDSDLFSVNVSEMYELSEKLDYVRLLDYSNETVCQLKTECGWVEISRDDYYRFVVHPRILFEIPARINTEYWSTGRDTASVPLDVWLNHEPESLYSESGDQLFWREFILSDSTRGRTLEERMIEATTYEDAVVRLCNYQSHSQPGGLMSFGYMTNDLQPMEIYRKAYGSCGEQSILQTALCRAFFIPAYVVGCRGEDHQWNQYLDPASGRWNHWDINYGVSGIGNVWVSGEGVNHTGKTISTITAFGPDNEVWPVTGSVLVPPGSGYMPGDSGYTCTASVDILVTDPAGVPVEGAMVLARSHWENANSVSEFSYTDESGSCNFQLGWEPNGGYTIDVISPFGSAGSTNITFTEGKSYSLRYTVPCSVPQSQKIYLPESDPSMNMSVTGDIFPVPFYSRSLYTIDDENSSESYWNPGWTRWPTSAPIRYPVYMNAENFRDYRNGLNCKAVPYPFTPEPRDTCYVVLDNRTSMFTWSEFHLPPSAFSVTDEGSYDVFAWLAEPAPGQNPAAVSYCQGSSYSGSDNNLSWIKYYQDIELQQDNPDDPLSAERIIGPFRIPAGERSLTIGTSSDQSGLDLDLFLFADRNANRMVDGMSELVLSSTSPTSNESIFIAEPDSSAVYWIYLHGWQVDEEGGMINLGLSFEPELINVHSLDPTGYQRIQPQDFSFMTSIDTFETGGIYLQTGDDVIVPDKSEDQWIFEAPARSSIFDTGSVGVFQNDGELIENLSWNIHLDSIPPELTYLSAVVDPDGMEVLVEAACTDESSGVSEAVSSIDNLEQTRLVLREDSIWSCRIDIAPFTGQSVLLGICFTDSAGNETEGNVDIHVPLRPAVLFSFVYPSRTVYDHRPVLQLYADFRDDLTDWSATAELSDSSGVFREELYPFVIDGNTIQFRPKELLDDGNYTVTVRITDQDMLLIAEHSWGFCIDTMTSVF